MTRHTTFRLETTGGTTIAYLAPQAQYRHELRNQVSEGETAQDRVAIARDLRRIGREVLIQGEFADSPDLPDAHESDLKTLFGSLPVTDMDQFNRVEDYLTGKSGSGGPYHLYVKGGTSYTASSFADMDPANGKYPTVQVTEWRLEHRSGSQTSRISFTLRCVAGVES